MNKSSRTLFTLEQFDNMYHNKNMSIYQIAQKYNTYPNKIRRLAQKLGASIRNKSEAQKIALQTGRQKHPTQGKNRSEDVKIKISESRANAWDNLSEKERQDIIKNSKKQWNQRNESDKIMMRQKASKGIRKAARYGSKLENHILEKIIDLGYKPLFHQQHTINNERMHLDILIPELKVAIEVDGPSHFEPIWGEDKLKKSKDADYRKNGDILSGGLCIIRILQKKNLTKKMIRDILLQTEKTLREIDKKFPTKNNRAFTIGV